MIYTMHIEKPATVIKQHGFHLGTDERIAEQFVLEKLKVDPEIISIALRRDRKLVRIYDARNIEP
jgi:hypothetical protein